MILLPDVKSALGVTTATDDAWLQEQINYYAAVVRLFTRRELSLASYTDMFLRVDSAWLQLSEWPVRSITSVVVDDAADDAGAWQPHTMVGRLHRGTNGLGTYLGANKVIVTYMGGYDPVPDDLKLVMLSLVRGAYEQKNTGGITAAATTATSDGIKSVTAFGVMKVDYETGSSGSTSALLERQRQTQLEDVLGNHVGILSRYVDHAKSLHMATG